ncbi:hypothetical protein D3C83_32370 [compost metagenome]
MRLVAAFHRMISVPRFHVVSMVKTAIPHSSGNQPPSAILVVFDATNSSSAAATIATPGTIAVRRRGSIAHATTATSVVSSSMVADTAMP